MDIVILLLVILALVIGLLWWVNRRNPGTFRRGDDHAENHMEDRKDWGPR